MEPLKDQFFNKAYVTQLAAEVKTAARNFDEQTFVQRVLSKTWKDLELKARMHHIADMLHSGLDCSFKESIRLLTPIVEKRIAEKTNSFGDMIFPDFVERFGLDDLETSVKALEIFTSACSSEFAVRPFIVRYPKEMMQQMLQWSKHANHHVRRLASEGCRPRLPWAMALPEFKKDPAPVLKILENLKGDESEYVRRSVANNLNDISKDNLELALQTAERWAGKKPETDALVRHALRNELKKGNKRALKLFALRHKTNAKISNLRITPARLKIGGSVDFHFSLSVPKKETLRLEYWIYFVKANGSTTKKVFQIAEKEFSVGEVHSFRKKHKFHDLTTRKHHAGVHRFVIAVNAENKSETKVNLIQ